MRLPLACLALVLTACPAPKPADSSADTAKSTAEAQAPKTAVLDRKALEGKAIMLTPKDAKDTNAAPTAEPKDTGPGATLSKDVKFPLSEMLGKKPGEVEPKLGEPTGKGMARKSCIRFLPERTWFECDYAMQRYADPTGTYDAVTLTYEDGVSTGIAFEGVPGEGAFDPKAALAHVGVTLPGEPKQSAPAENVTLWSWFNGSARLLVHDKQYRVEVSSVDGTWDSSKVEFFLNHPLTDEQKAKIRTPGSAG